MRAGPMGLAQIPNDTDNCVKGDNYQNLDSWFSGDDFSTLAKLKEHKKAWNIQNSSEFTLDGPRGKVLSMVVGNDTLFAGAQGVLALSGMSDVEGKPILFSSSIDNSVRLYELPSCPLTLSIFGCRFLERGRLFAKKVVQSIEIGPNGLFFTEDGTDLLMVWKWLEVPKVAST
ncbi:unnamed protein product [Lupinus luteus]|uniref:Uncharacterized protein n=1 Tax=Lupinus luteus TaxID=3873 RepID=A0AAV1YFH6_LUPLU